uniref:Elongator complex protein 6 n=1 Tax=Romanomermis culicivorax TaxID=13658 RepID=A0A915L9W1_ROMCU
MKHDLKNLPSNQTIVVEESDNADGSFLIYHFLSLFLRSPANAKVYLVSCRQTVNHFNTVLSKLGVQFKRSIDQNRCRIFDLMNHFRVNDFNFDVNKSIELIESDFSTFCDQVNSPILFIIDDVSILFDFGLPIDEIYRFFHALRFCAKQRKACFSLTLSTYDDNLLENHEKFAKIVRYYADYLLKVEKLKTGLSKEVSGTLSIINFEQKNIEPLVTNKQFKAVKGPYMNDFDDSAILHYDRRGNSMKSTVAWLNQHNSRNDAVG